jgi:VWFA-related protein
MTFTRSTRRIAGILAAGALAGATGVAHQAVGRGSGAGDWPAGVTRVDVMVENARGEPVSGLTAHDFTVLVDDQPVQVQAFSGSSALTVAVLVDVTKSMGATVEAGLPSSARPDRPILVAVEEIPLRGLRPDDRVRVGAIGRRLLLSERFTTDAQERTRAWHTLFALPPIDWLGPSRIWDALSDVTLLMAGEPGQRAILMLTDGRASGNLMGSGEVTERAALAGVSVNCVIHGVEPPPKYADLGVDSTKALRTIADVTGGTYLMSWDVVPSNDVMNRSKAFERMLDRLHHAYTLGFTPAVADGKPHALKVRVSRPGAIVRARTMFVAVVQ